MPEPKFKPHSVLTIAIDYKDKTEPFHDKAPLVGDHLKLKVDAMDYDIMGLPQRLWRTLIAREADGKMQPGERQLRAFSNEGLEVLRNSLGNLHAMTTRILNERGRIRYGLPDPQESQTRPGLPSGAPGEIEP